VTGIAVEPEAPLASCTVAVSVVAPFGVATVFQGSVTWTPGSFAVPTVAPPARSVKTLPPLAAPSTQMLTHTVLPTVAPLVGLVMNTFSAPPDVGGGGGGGAPPLATVIAIDAEPVLPLASRALAVSVWGPSATADVVHGIDTGPVLDVVLVATV